MKKNGVLKALGITFVIYVILSWIIPVGYYSNGSFTTNTIEPIGIFDIVKYPIVTLTSSVFVLTSVCLLLIGGFYGVLKATGIYSKLVDSICKKMKGNEEKFLILSTFILALLASLTALTIPLFLMVPLVIGVVLAMGYNKLTALLSSVGAILVGNMATTYGFNIAGYIHHFYNTDMNSGILFKIILFVLLTGGLILFILMLNKNTKLTKLTKEELKEIPYYEEKKNNKTKILVPIIVIVITFILILVGMYNWYYGLGVELFNNFHTAITKVEYNNLPILSYLLGNVNAIGYWNNYEFAVILIILTFVIGKIGKLSGKEMVDSFIDGAKKMLPVAFFAMIANLMFLLMNSNSSGYTYYATICNYFFGLSDKLGAVSVGITSFLGGILYNDFPYMINVVSTQVGSIYNNLTLVTFIQYAIHGLVQLVAPTSVLLVAGLTYLEIPYKEYLKSVWKFVLGALLVIIALSIMISLV